MSSSSSGEKTEKPTPKRLRDARKKGQVSKSKDLSSSFTFIAGIMVFYLIIGDFSGKIMKFFTFIFKRSLHGSVSNDLTFDVLSRGGSLMFSIVLPIMGGMFVLATFVTYIQVGAVFSMEPLKPQLNKLNPIEGFKNIFFKKKTYINLFKDTFKLFIVAIIFYKVISSSFRDLLIATNHSLALGIIFSGKLLYKACMATGIFFVMVGAIDFFIEKKLFLKEMMMTKDEVKREYKQMEGDPTYKAQRKRLHQEILSHNMIEDVKNADVVVVNPTHIAVALKYDREKMNAPRVSAKGNNIMAEKIIEVAKQYNIPIMRNVPLAHSLNELEIGDEIPEELYEAVAEVLTWVYKMREG